MRQLAISLVLGILLLVNVAAAACPASFSNYQIINLTVGSGTTSQDYQTDILLNASNVGASWTWSEACVNGNSTRVIFMNESMNANLSFWVESCSAASTYLNVTVKVDQNLSTSAYGIAVCYGDSSHTPQSNGTATFVFFDDGEEGTITDKWTNYAGGGTQSYSTDQAYHGSYSMKHTPHVYAVSIGLDTNFYKRNRKTTAYFYDNTAWTDGETRLWLGNGTSWEAIIGTRLSGGGSDDNNYMWFDGASSGSDAARQNGWVQMEYITGPTYAEYYDVGSLATNETTLDVSNVYQVLLESEVNTMYWDLVTVREWHHTDPDPSYVVGSEQGVSHPNLTITLDVLPATIYNLTDANFSIHYNETSGLQSNITVNLTINGVNYTAGSSVTQLTGVSSNSTTYFFIEHANFSKNDNITLAVNLTTYGNLETHSETLDAEVQNTAPSAADITFTPHSIIITDTLYAAGSSTDDDGDTITYHYLLGWNNGTNITGWNASINYYINTSNENDTLRVYVLADDGEVNGSSNSSDITVTKITILWPASAQEYYGRSFNFSFNFTTQISQPCYEYIDNTSYALGNITTGEQNNTRAVWYGSHTYNATCHSLQDSSRVYCVNTTFENYYANWTVSIMTENDWDVPLEISEANLSIIIMCDGGETYVYNFTGSEITGVKPPCDVESVSAKVDYSADSYLRERQPPCSGMCELELYMVDALIYTVLQIPIYMSDYEYYNSKIELYKTSGGEHYTIAEGYFDVERKYVTYLTKDNTYLIRLEEDGAIRDIGFLYAATATAQYLSLSEINLEPDITLISDNILMSAEFDDPSLNQSTLRIQYQDLINMTESVRVQIFSMSNNTAWYDNTIHGSSNFTISVNNVNTTRHSIHFTVEHAVLGNSPIDFTVGVGSFAGFDLGLSSEMLWLYNGFAFFIILMTTFVITPENRLPGYLLLLAELGIFSVGTWFIFQSASFALFIAFIIAGIIYEIRHKGIS